MRTFLPFNKTSGFAATALLFVIILIAFFMVGTLSFGPSVQEPVTGDVTFTCCDSGSGNECKPLTGDGEVITYNGQRYGLLKSRTEFVEGNLHLKDSGQTVLINGESRPIVLNSSDTHKNFKNTPPNTCDNTDTDKYLKDYPPGMSISDRRIINYCTQIPNDQIIYVCTNNCPTTPTKCDPAYEALYKDPLLSCYGDETTEYDAYFRLSDYDEATNTGIPDFIKNCDTQSVRGRHILGPNPTIVVDEFTRKDNLQLETFKIVGSTNISPWFSPFCKPAIYLYPKQTTNISVGVEPLGKMTVSIPDYSSGWNVTAQPDGKLTSNSRVYPYLYYEANIPDIAITKPNEGFLTLGKQGLQTKLVTLLPALGLSDSESRDFVNYWTRTLSDSPYYIIRIISNETLDAIAPLSISPQPDSVIRVTLYFELSNSPVILKEPTIQTPARAGFTVVEWGGLIKQNPDQAFTCFN